jgi:hypothetical protein
MSITARSTSFAATPVGRAIVRDDPVAFWEDADRKAIPRIADVVAGKDSTAPGSTALTW